MDNKKINQDEKSAKEKAIEVVPAILAAIFLLLGMYFNNTTLKIVFCSLAVVIGLGMYLFLLIREIIQRKRRKKENSK